MLASALPIFAMSFAPNAAAQQRQIVNPSFEQVNPTGTQVFSGDTPLPDEFTIASEDYFPGWSSTNGQIEIWADGFQNRSASEGSFLAELNPSEPVGLFQEVCLVNGETLAWSFDHSARTGSAPTLQTTVYEVVDSANNLIQFLDTNTVTEMGNANDHSQNAWVTVSDTAIYTGPTGTQRLQFRSTNSGSNGNFLDNIGVTLIPLVTFENLNTSALETATTGLPEFVISGNVTTSFEIAFTITGGTATQGAGADYTVTSNSITIPVGNYDGVSSGSAFPLPITILTDAITEGSETIEIAYQNVTPSTAAVLAGPSCSSPSATAIHTILDVPPTLDIAKVFTANADEDSSSSISIGDTLTYTVTATNTGSAAQTGVVVTDNLITPSSNTCATVAVGGTCVLTGTYIVTVTDAGGNFTNTASVVSNQVVVPLEDTVTVAVDAAAPSIGIVKTLTTNADEDSSGSVSIGDTLTYTIVATNTGNAAQTGFVVTDNLITPSSNTCATVAVGGTCTLTGTYVVAVGDAGGDIVNTASVVSNEVPTAVTDSVTTPVVINPIVAANDTTTAVAGASNVLDIFDGDTVNGTAATPTNVVLTLAPSETVPAELTFDAATGAVGVSPSATAGSYSFDYQICESVNPANCTTATATVTVAAAPSIGIVKTLTNNADGDNSNSVSIGDTLTYTIVATNTGNAAQTGFVVTDNLITPSSNTCATVAVGGTCTLTGTYVVAVGDAGGDIVNTASVVSNEVPTAVTDSVTTPVVINPIVAANDTTTAVAGASNVLDIFDGDTVNGTAATPTNVVLTLAPSETVPAELTFDAATGAVGVSPSATAGSYSFDYQICESVNPTNCTTATATVTVAAAPSIGIVKTLTNNADGDSSGSVSIGDVLTYTIVATNTGNAAQTNFVVTDNLITPSSNSCATVAVGASCTLSGTYVVAVGDAGGDIVNTASVVSNEVPTAVTDSVTTPVVINPITAANDTTTAAAGASNVLDLFDGDTVNGTAATPTNVVLTLAPSETVPAELTFDAATGAVGVSPSATAGSYSFDYQICESVNPANCTTATATVTVAAAPSIGIVKTLTNNADEDSSGSVSIGDTLTYTIVATNTGNAAQTNFVVTDNLITPSSNTCATVAVGASCTLSGTYVVAVGDAGGDIVNTASVVSNEVPTAVTDSVTTPVVINPITAANDTTTAVAGASNVLDLFDGDTVNGTAATPTNVVLTLASGETVPSELTFDAATGAVSVSPSATAGSYSFDYQICESVNPANCTTATATVTVAAAPSIGIVKTLTNNADGDSSGSVSIGDTLTYTIVATNTGNAAQTNFVVTDNLITPSSNTCATVAVGASCTLSGTYVVAVGDAGGNIVNTASVVSNEVPTAVTDSVTTTVDGAPIIEAEPDVVVGIDSAVGGTGVINVLDDDLLNGQPINPGQVTVVFSPDATIPTGITYNTDGSVDVAPGVRPGTYVVPYEICDVNDATNCTVSNLTVTISSPTGLAPLNVTKSTQTSNVNIGDIVPYTITVTNTEDSARFDLDLVDIAPPGFSLIEETSRLGGVAIEPVTTGRELVLDGIDFTANETKVWTLHMVVGAGVSDGIHINQAFIRDASGAEISARAEAVVKMSIDPLFDCSEVIGKVYDDMNRNGYQDQGEPGIAGVRLATVKGLIIISDEHGRYHIACADVPNANIGSNFILKIDERSLPTGYRMTTENPRVERLTRGKISKINFGASIQRVVTLDLSNEAFLPGSTRLQAAMMPNIAQLMNVLKAQPSILRLNYHDYEGFGDLSERRLKAVEAEAHRLWKAQGCCYTLETERKVLRTGGYRPNHVQRGGAFR